VVLMRRPTLSRLPSPPPGKIGWPWTEETLQPPDTMPDGSPWPRISIVTPSYNQGQFIEETIRSALLQGYPNLEYIVIDGDSSDNSVEIIRKYEPWLTYWVSEPDNGQTEALNKGFERTTGSILTWLNSDDRLQPGALQSVAEFFLRHPEVGIAYGNFNKIDEYSNHISRCEAPEFNLRHHIVRDLIPQPAALFRREVWGRIGPLNHQFHYVMDHDFWSRAALHFPIAHFSALMADVRLHGSSKTVGQTIKFFYELERFFDDFFALPDLSPQIRVLEPQARGANYFVMGRLYLKTQQHQAARQAFAQAWRTYPLHPNKLAILPFLADTFLKTNIGFPLFRLALWLKNGFNKNCLDEQTL